MHVVQSIALTGLCPRKESGKLMRICKPKTNKWDILCEIMINLSLCLTAICNVEMSTALQVIMEPLQINSGDEFVR